MVNYEKDRAELVEKLSGSEDIMKIDFDIAGHSSFILYVDGMSDRELVDRNIIEPLKYLERLEEPWIAYINQNITISVPIMIIEDLDEAATKVAEGDIVMLIDGAEKLYGFSLRNYKTRAITEPPTSTVLRGPREGFVEDMKTNMTMIRRKLRSPSLVFKHLKVGRYSETSLAITWLEGIAEESIVNQLIEKIENIDIDGIIDSSYISRYIEENKYSLFNQIGTTEKPDIIAGKLLEGRIAIIVDGSPTVLTVPFVFFEHFQASEDYYIKSYRATLTRIIRVIAMIIAILLPAAYVALQEFQYQMFPVKMLISIMNSIYGVPLTPTLEMIVLLVIFEILSETSVRMPRHVSTALAIVGAIVLGETAVNAGLLSIPSVLVTAISTIGLYSVPDEVDSGSVLRLGFTMIAGVLGIFGLIISTIALIGYMVGLRSFDTSFLAPFSPYLHNDLQDGIAKANLIDMQYRPHSIPTHNRKRSN